MQTIDKNLTQYHLIVITEKRQRAMSLQDILSKMGFKVSISQHVYDATQIITQEMPHIIITEAILQDGNADTLIEKLAAHEGLLQIPIILSIQNKTKAEMAIATSREFAGLFVGPINPKELVTKIIEIIQKFNHVSPYFIPGEDLPFDTDIMSYIETTIIGKFNDYVVAKSGTELDSHASFLCQPKEEKYDSALFSSASNVIYENDIYNIFPLHRIIGKGRLWLNEIPNLDSKENYKDLGKKVIILEEDIQRFNSFSRILVKHDIELIQCTDIKNLTPLMIEKIDQLCCIYFTKPENSPEYVSFKTVYEQLPPHKKPTIIMTTNKSGQRSTPLFKHLKIPFSLSALIELINASTIKGAILNHLAKQSAFVGVGCRFEAPAKIIGLDEAGGILEVKFPVVQGCQLTIDHEFLKKIWNGLNKTIITRIVKHEEKPNTWQIRFESMTKGLSKAKYFVKLTQEIAKDNKKETEGSTENTISYKEA